MAALSKADYLKRYLSGADEAEKKKKKKERKEKSKHTGMKIIDGDAFVSVQSTARDQAYSSDEEREELKLDEEVKEKIKKAPKFKSSFISLDPEPSTTNVKEEKTASSSNGRNREEDSRRRKRHDSDSPVRRQRHDSNDSGDISPPRRRRHDSDNSPPRKKNRDSSQTRHRKNSDNSPPRRHGTPDQSPPRRRRYDSDSSPPRNRRAGSRGIKNEVYLSPPRSKIAGSSSRRHVDEPEIESKEKTLDGKVAGLQTAAALRVESLKIRERESKMFEDMDVETSGRGAATVVREKQIKRGKDKTEDKEKKEREAKKQQELNDKYKSSWNLGVRQIEQRQSQLEEMARVAAEPLARAVDNEAMNEHMKDVLHEDDPMVSFMRKKNREEAVDRGELVYPTYNKPFIPNRYGIRPGYRWDGVDRSNGFEGKLALMGNKKKAQDSEYYQNLSLYE